jgi:hypothetical protein
MGEAKRRHQIKGSGVMSFCPTCGFGLCRIKPDMTAGVRKFGVAKGATTSRNRLMIRVMTLTSSHDTSPRNTSPRDKSRDEKTKEAVLATFPPSWRSAVSMAGPSGDSEYNIELRPPISEEAALAIGRAFERAFPGREVTLNTWWTLETAPGAPSTPWSPWSWPPGLRPPSWWDR